MKDSLQQRVQQTFFKESAAPQSSDDWMGLSFGLGDDFLGAGSFTQRVIQNMKATLGKQKKLELPTPSTSQGKSYQEGHYFNQVDTEFSAGFEQYLPTPNIRLRIAKERIQREMEMVNQELVKYRQITPQNEEIQRKITALLTRIEALKTHEAEIDEELSLLYSSDSLIFQVLQEAGKWGDAMAQSTQKTAKLFSQLELVNRLDPQRYQFVTLNQQLQNLSAVLDEQLGKGQEATLNVDGLLNQYDKTLHEIEKVAEHLKARLDWRERFNEKVLRFARKLYS